MWYQNHFFGTFKYFLKCFSQIICKQSGEQINRSGILANYKLKWYKKSTVYILWVICRWATKWKINLMNWMRLKRYNDRVEMMRIMFERFWRWLKRVFVLALINFLTQKTTEFPLGLINRTIETLICC